MDAVGRRFSACTVRKRYHAVVIGVAPEASGVIDLAIGRDPVDRKRMQARVGQTRLARTRYVVAESFGSPGIAARVDVEPHTGRTHQIRVHLASIGHAIVGDRVYGSSRARGRDRAPDAIETFQRQALHTGSLSLRHPLDGREIGSGAFRWTSTAGDTLRACVPRGDETETDSLRRAASAHNELTEWELLLSRLRASGNQCAYLLSISFTTLLSVRLAQPYLYTSSEIPELAERIP